MKVLGLTKRSRAPEPPLCVGCDCVYPARAPVARIDEADEEPVSRLTYADGPR